MAGINSTQDLVSSNNNNAPPFLSISVLIFFENCNMSSREEQGHPNVAGRRVLENPISLQQMEDGIVDRKVFSAYCNAIIHFFNWCSEREVDGSPPLLTNLAKETVANTQTAHVGERRREHWARIKAIYLELIRKAKTAPLVIEENLTSDVVMEYISTGANQRTGKALSESSYKGNRSAIFHLFRCQNGRGPTEEYRQQIRNLWTGFGRLQNRARAIQNPNGDDSDGSSVDNEDDRDEFKEGKEPMSIELYRAVLKWLLEYASVDGVLSACFLCLTWNLACRGNNTAKLKLSHLSWTKFDCMQINFKHTKTDISGAQKRIKRNLYANVIEPEIDFTFVLGLYLAIGFTTSSRQEEGFKLFPGSSESTTKRVSRKLKEVLEQHKEEVLSMGYSCVNDIGIHSLRKGAATYLGSLPGGPSPVAICHRCGWSTGKVLDIYFQHLQRGDEFVGRCLSLLNLMSSDFALSPAYFDADLVSEQWMKNCLQRVFPCFYHLDNMQRILQQCLASMMHHREHVARFEANHPARSSIAIFRDHSLMEPGLVALNVKKAWETKKHISGVPPHVKELADLAEIKDQLGSIVEKIFEKVMKGTTDFFDSRRIGGGEITEERLMQLIQNASDATRSEVADRLTSQLERLMEAFQSNVTGQLNDEPGEISVPLTAELPHDFQFPSSNVLDLWTQWNIPNVERSIPALKNVLAESYKFLDSQPRSAGECNRLTRLQHDKKDSRRESRRTASDMKSLCKFIEEEACKFGFMNITEENMLEAFEAVTLEWETLGGRESASGRSTRFEQWSWKTTLKFVHDLKRDRRAAANAANTSNAADSMSGSVSSATHSRSRRDSRHSRRVAARRTRQQAAPSSEGSGTDRTTASVPRRPRRRQRTQGTARDAPQDIDLADHFPNAFDGLTTEQICELHHVDPQEIDRIRRAEQQAADQEMLANNRMVVHHPRGVAQNHGNNTLAERRRYANTLELVIQGATAPAVERRMGRNGRLIGQCWLPGCCFPNMELYACHLEGCNRHVHHLCADESQLASNHDERYKYCSSEHKQIGDGR